MAEPSKAPLLDAVGMGAGMYTGKWRKKKCGQCGDEFTQRQLSASFAAWVATWPAGARAKWASIVTENALPLFCPRCERRSL